jgi:hypothetical protein
MDPQKKGGSSQHIHNKDTEGEATLHEEESPNSLQDFDYKNNEVNLPSF